MVGSGLVGREVAELGVVGPGVAGRGLAGPGVAPPRLLLLYVGQDVLRALQQVVAQEEAAQRVLDAATHLHQVLEDVLARQLVRFDVDNADGDQQVTAARTVRRSDIRGRNERGGTVSSKVRYHPRMHSPQEQDASEGK